MNKYILIVIVLAFLIQNVSTCDLYRHLPDFETIDEKRDEQWQQFLDGMNKDDVEKFSVVYYNLPTFPVRDVKLQLFHSNDLDIANFSANINDEFIEKFLIFMKPYDKTKFYDVSWQVRLQVFLEKYFVNLPAIDKAAFFTAYSYNIVNKSLKAMVCEC